MQNALPINFLSSYNKIKNNLTNYFYENLQLAKVSFYNNFKLFFLSVVVPIFYYSYDTIKKFHCLWTYQYMYLIYLWLCALATVYICILYYTVKCILYVAICIHIHIY